MLTDHSGSSVVRLSKKYKIEAFLTVRPTMQYV